MQRDLTQVLKGNQPVVPSLELWLAEFQAHFLSQGEVKNPSPQETFSR